ncbi:hypothetical protein GQX74_004078 [Glossina fuscipes]|nr:hypothetical protein GQX74_004078 [Glossina fuscipes]
MRVALDNADWPSSSISTLDEVMAGVALWSIVSSPSFISSAPSAFVSEDSSPISSGSSSGCITSRSSWEDDTYNVEPNSTSTIDPTSLIFSLIWLSDCSLCDQFIRRSNLFIEQCIETKISYIALAYSDLPDNRRKNCNIAKYKLNDKQLCICIIQQNARVEIIERKSRLNFQTTTRLLQCSQLTKNRLVYSQSLFSKILGRRRFGNQISQLNDLVKKKETFDDDDLQAGRLLRVAAFSICREVWITNFIRSADKEMNLGETRLKIYE